MRILLCVLLIRMLCVSLSFGQGPVDSSRADTMMIELGVTIEVLGERVTPDRTPFPFEKERLNQVLTQHGFGLITKGVFLAQDVQADGFKRDDITITIDGERYHSACPNRMDSPLTRSNALEMDAIELNKTSSSCCSGLGGSIAYHRQPIDDGNRLRTGVSHAGGASESSDLGFALSTRHNRASGRYAVGSGYEDGDGQSFVDRYGYRKDATYRLYESGLTGEWRDLTYHAELTYTEDVMFPYLQMDERLNRVVSASLARRGYKAYVNHTRHKMDNGLRTSMMSMATDATNTTVGVNAPFAEAFYRHWAADNTILMPTASIDNKLMPGVDEFAASVSRKYAHRALGLWGRVGLAHFGIAADDRASFYRPLYGEQSTNRIFATWGAGASLNGTLWRALTGVLAVDGASEPPTAQSLYITVQRPMGKPWWSGNPGLHQPTRTSLRGSLEWQHLTLESSASYVWNYVDLVATTVPERDYLTYGNVDATILSAHVRGRWRYVEFATSYTWAEHADNGTPVAEIPPFALTYTITSPSVANTRGYWRHTYNDAQTRIDPGLKEWATTSWHRFDAGMSWDGKPVRIRAEVENVFDELYAQHLSYLRDPFASGARVYEPGRTVRISLVLNTPSR